MPMKKRITAYSREHVGRTPWLLPRAHRRWPIALLLSCLVMGAANLAAERAATASDLANHTRLHRWAKLYAVDSSGSESFGSSVAISGDTMAIGAPGDNGQGKDSGAVYVFVRTGNAWTQQAKLSATDGAAGDNFGASVAISDDTLIVGALAGEANGQHSGSAFIFVRTGTTWTQQAKLLAADGQEGDAFGVCAAISHDTAIVGAWADDDLGSMSGSAYVFVRTGTTWTQQAKLLAADGAAHDWFGMSVAVDGDTVAVGAWRDDDHGPDSGSVYVFVRTGNTWTQQAKLSPANAGARDGFGACVAISGDTLVVGATDGFYDNPSSASASVFVRTGASWTQQAKLSADNGSIFGRFGWSVAISGDIVMVGAPDEDAWAGAAYVFARSSNLWIPQGKFSLPDHPIRPSFAHCLGYSVGISNRTVVAGTPDDSDLKIFGGAAYVFSVSVPPLPDAGPDRDVREGARVTLSAVNSRDRDNGIASYRWKQISGKPVKLDKSESRRATFVAPRAGTGSPSLEFELTVMDRGGMQATDRCLINAKSDPAGDHPPVAEAGPAQRVTGGKLVTLDGSGSRDRDGSALRYSWRQIAGPPVVIQGQRKAQSHFTAPTPSSDGTTLGFRLTVTDRAGFRAEDTTLVNVCAGNQPPKARAGKSQSVAGGKRIQLDGSASSDPDDGMASYRWQQLSGPPVKLSNPLAIKPTFRSPRAGQGGATLLFQLTVTDQGGLQSQARCLVRVKASP
jgi:hypothetical protein